MTDREFKKAWAKLTPDEKLVVWRLICSLAEKAQKA